MSHLRHLEAHELEQDFPEWLNCGLLLQRMHPGGHISFPALLKYAREELQVGHQPLLIALWKGCCHGLRCWEPVRLIPLPSICQMPCMLLPSIECLSKQETWNAFMICIDFRAVLLHSSYP